MEHKQKIIIYGCVIVAVLLSFVTGAMTKDILTVRYNITTTQNECNQYIIEHFYGGQKDTAYLLPFNASVYKK